jgi:hypothetical protein
MKQDGETLNCVVSVYTPPVEQQLREKGEENYQVFATGIKTKEESCWARSSQFSQRQENFLKYIQITSTSSSVRLSTVLPYINVTVQQSRTPVSYKVFFLDTLDGPFGGCRCRVTSFVCFFLSNISSI